MKRNKGRIIIIRGIPGSGKTTLANEICRQWPAVNVELDMFRQPTPDYPYLFLDDCVDNHNASRWCAYEAMRWLRQGMNVVYSSTLVKLSHIENFLFEVEAEEPFCVIECRGGWASKHNVPRNVIRNMTTLLKDNPYEGQIVLRREALSNLVQTVKLLLEEGKEYETNEN